MRCPAAGGFVPPVSCSERPAYRPGVRDRRRPSQDGTLNCVIARPNFPRSATRDQEAKRASVLRVGQVGDGGCQRARLSLIAGCARRTSQLRGEFGQRGLAL
jgi:hypothetical protein